MSIANKVTHAVILAALSSSAFAADDHAWYAAASAGIFQGLFNTQYNDQSDVIPQNFRQPVSQNSYDGGVAVGYSKKCCSTFFWGGELGIYGSTYHANFATGASSAAFTDTLAINGNLDLTFMPGFIITDTVAAYAKAGLSYARMTSSIYSPTGLTPTFVIINNSKNILGAALGVGVCKHITKNVSTFIEYNYHDYGTINLPAFQNFTTTYGRAIHVYSQSLSVGAAYSF